MVNTRAHKELVLAGICVDCQINEAVDEFFNGRKLIRCDFCLEDRASREKGIADKNRAAGLCYCGRPRKPKDGKPGEFWKSCSDCIETYKRANKKRPKKVS